MNTSQRSKSSCGTEVHSFTQCSVDVKTFVCDESSGTPVLGASSLCSTSLGAQQQPCDQSSTHLCVLGQASIVFVVVVPVVRSLRECFAPLLVRAQQQQAVCVSNSARRAHKPRQRPPPLRLHLAHPSSAHGFPRAPRLLLWGPPGCEHPLLVEVAVQKSARPGHNHNRSDLRDARA